MKRKRITNNQVPYIKNANLIGNGPTASPIDGSFVKGIEQQRMQEAAKDRLVKSAENSQSYTANKTVNNIRKLTP